MMIISPFAAFPAASRTIRTLSTLLVTICFVLLMEFIVQLGLNQSLLLGPFLFNRITVTVALMVAAVGSVVLRFSLKYMAFDPAQDRFCLWVFITVLSGTSLILSDHLLMLFLSWSVMSLSLHKLLAHYRDNPVAQNAAWKKFRFSRIGDCALLAAIVLIYQSTDSWSLSQFLSNLRDLPSISLIGVAWFIAIAAMTKSAQFPFHRWLPETLDAPTPVSAIMHAGAINGGGVLLLKFASAITQVSSACLALSIVGCLTMTVGMRGLWSEPTRKGKLAWSTVAQMGFMTAECGIAAFAAAFLHIVAHGLYKAECFLRSGTLPKQSASRRELGRYQFGWVILCAAACLPIFWLASEWFHLGFKTPRDIGLAFIIALSIGQAVVAIPTLPTWARPLTVLPLTGLALAFYALIEVFVGDLVPSPPNNSPIYWFAALLPGATLAYLSFQFYSREPQPVPKDILSTNLNLNVVNQIKEYTNV
ncbi:hypothetical protein BH11ARM1_BH11ARM1_01080 [soil metagenome]